MNKLTDKEFKSYLQAVHDKISEALDITKEKSINYGHQFVVELAQAKLTLNIYNGKKGISYVFSGDSALEGKVRELLGEAQQGAAQGSSVASTSAGASVGAAEPLPRPAVMSPARETFLVPWLSLRWWWTTAPLPSWRRPALRTASF